MTRCQFGQKTPKNTTHGWKFTPNSPIGGFDFLGRYWMNPTPGTVGNLARRIPDDLGRLVDRDYGSKNVDPGPPTGDCVEDIARTIAWYEELVKAGFPTGDAEARLDVVLERCKNSPPTVEPPGSEPKPCCCCESGVWNGSIEYWSAGFILNFGKFSGTLTCQGEPEKKMSVSGLVVGSGWFAGYSGSNTAKYYTMFGKCPSDIQGTTQGGIFSLGVSVGPLGLASADFPMNSDAANGGEAHFDTPNINYWGADYPSIGGDEPFKPHYKLGIGFNQTGHRVDVAECE